MWSPNARAAPRRTGRLRVNVLPSGRYERLPAIAMVAAAAVPSTYGDRHQETSRGADPDDARKQERRGQASKHTGSCHGLKSPRAPASRWQSRLARTNQLFGLYDLPCRWRRRGRAGRRHVRSGRDRGRRRRRDVRLRRHPHPVIRNRDAIASELILAGRIVDDGHSGRREHHHAPARPPPDVVRGPETGSMLESPAAAPVEVPVLMTDECRVLATAPGRSSPRSAPTASPAPTAERSCFCRASLTCPPAP